MAAGCDLAAASTTSNPKLAARDLGPFPVIPGARFTEGMFVGDQARLGVGFDAARAGLANRALGGSVATVSAAAYGAGLTGLARVGPSGWVRGISRLAGCVRGTWRQATGPLCSRCGGKPPVLGSGCSRPWMLTSC